MSEAKDLVDEIRILPVRFQGEQGIPELLAEFISFLEKCPPEFRLVDARGRSQRHSGNCHQDCPATAPGTSLPTANTRGRSSIR